MKPIFYLFVTLLAGLFVLSIYSNVKLIEPMEHDVISADTTMAPEIRAFDPAMENIPGFTELESRMEMAIRAGKTKDRELKNWLIAANFSVTVLTALAALIASIKTTKIIAENRTTIWIAVITFGATLVNFGQTEITSAREDNNKRTEQIRRIRDTMESLPVNELSRELTRFIREFNEL